MDLPVRIVCDGCKVAFGEKHTCSEDHAIVNGQRTPFRCECPACRSWEHPTHLAAQLEQAFNLIGHSMMTEDFAAKLLAFVSIFGSELTVLHEGLHAGIMIAQQKANIKGGHIPDERICLLINKYSKELTAAEMGIKLTRPKDDEAFLIEQVPWLMEIYDRYEMASRGKMRKQKKSLLND